MVCLTMCRGGRLDRRGRRDGRRHGCGFSQAGHPLALRRRLRQGREDDLFDRPQLLVIATEQGARGLDLDVDEGKAAAAVPQDAEAALLGLAADLGKLILECYLEHW